MRRTGNRAAQATLIERMRGHEFALPHSIGVRRASSALPASHRMHALARREAHSVAVRRVVGRVGDPRQDRAKGRPGAVNGRLRLPVAEFRVNVQA